VSPPTLTALTLNATSVPGGTPSIGTVTLSGPAPPGGFSVTLHSTNIAVAAGPAVATVPAGAATTTFTVTTRQVPSPTHVFISASYQGLIKNASLGVVPQLGAPVQQAPQQAVPLQQMPYQQAPPQQAPVQQAPPPQTVPTRPTR
jgi:hypothetical protein